MTDPTPELKPRVPPEAPGSKACGCCDGVAAETPRATDNRDGLSSIAYRIGDYAQFRESLQARLSSSEFPQLSRLRTRDSDDFTIGLIDAFACAADVLTFYQERIANESYLRTAVERVSLQELGKLIGYRLRPGVAAETWIAFTLEKPPAPPPGLAREPGAFVTGVPPSIPLPIGLKVQSVPGPDEKPQTFETVEALSEARPSWNALTPWLEELSAPKRHDTVSYFSGVRNNLRAGDALLFAGSEFAQNPNDNRWDFRVIESVELFPAEDRTRVRWKRGLGSIDPPLGPTTSGARAFALRKRGSVFGHNAPMWGSMSRSFRSDYPGGTKSDGTLTDDWPADRFVLSPSGATSNGGHVDLDSVYSEVKNGGYAVLAKGAFQYSNEPAPAGTYVELFQVTNVAEVSRAEFALAAKVTRLRLRGDNYSIFDDQVRETTVFLQSEELAFAPYPVTAPVSGDRIPVSAGSEGLLPGRKLIVRGRRVSDGTDHTVRATLVEAHAAGAGRAELEITPPLTEPLARDSVVVHANVALASHGESVSQILGNGDASQPFQRFELKQLPLTHRSAKNELGAAAELSVRVGDVAFRERTSLFGADPNERAYTLEQDERGRNFVVFGDGLRGVRLPTGNNNVRASYRKGLGSAGNVRADSLTQLMSRPLGLKGASNPLPAAGGTDPEPAGAAQRSMPLTTRTLGRAVSLLDYEDYARAFSGIAKASARMLSLSSGRVVALTVAAEGGGVLTPDNPLWSSLLEALRANGDPYVAVRLLSHRASTFHLGLRVKRDPDYLAETVLAAVEAALRQHYAFEARALSQPVQASEVISIAQAVPGVVAVELTRLYGGTEPFAQTTPSRQVRLLAGQMQVLAGSPRAAELLTLDPAPFDALEELT